MNPETVRCPTCRATQAWADTCRRCKSDLRLLRLVAQTYTAARGRCLANLRHNRPHAALEDARECLALRDDAGTRRLLTACELLCGNWAAARSRAVQFLAESTPGQEA